MSDVELVFIPCSGRKRDGGEAMATAQGVGSQLGVPGSEHLASWRRAMALEVGQEPGTDLGSQSDNAPPLLPAYVRYDGNIYRKAQLKETDVERGSLRLFIVSALYGLLDAREPIRKYNLSMSDTLQSRTKVKTWWRRKGLGELLSTLAKHLEAVRIHDLLSGHYRDAVRGYEATLPPGCGYAPYNYPGLGSGSDFHRGNDVRKILDAPKGELPGV